MSSVIYKYVHDLNGVLYHDLYIEQNGMTNSAPYIIVQVKDTYYSYHDSVYCSIPFWTAYRHPFVTTSEWAHIPPLPTASST